MSGQWGNGWGAGNWDRELKFDLVFSTAKDDAGQLRANDKIHEILVTNSEKHEPPPGCPYKMLIFKRHLLTTITRGKFRDCF